MRKLSKRLIGPFTHDQRGNTAILFGLMVVPMLGITGLAVDYLRAMHARTELQAVTDAAAIAGARLPATANQNRYEAAEKFYAANLALTDLEGVDAEITASNAEVRVEAAYPYPTVMLSLFGVETLDIEAVTAARSQVENGGVACLLALSPTSSDGLHLQGINQAAADDCWAWVNSSSSTAINADGTSQATAQGFCTVGGATGADHFGPAPYTGCEEMEDPFADKFAASYPASDTCTETDLELKNGTFTLSPGVYCGNTVLRPQADVTFLPGDYVIKDGYFEIQGQAAARGDGVTLFFTGSDTRLIVRGGGEIDLKGPTSGDYAGFVLVERASGSSIKETIIQGGGRVRLVGILYAPNWRVNIGGNGEINQESQFFAMIADHFYMEGNGRLWINSDALAEGMPEVMPKIKSGPVLTQ